MIVQWGWGVLTGALTWMIGILPAPSVPSWLSDAPGQIESFMSGVGDFGTWIPVSVVVGVLAFLMLCLASSTAIKLFRIVLSFLTAGGGSAA